jgi:hypothetical protein
VRLVQFAQRCEDGCRQWLASTGIQSCQVVDEDLSRDRLAVVNKVLEFLRLPRLDAADLPPVRFLPMDRSSALTYKATMAGIGVLAITAGATLLGVLIPTLASLWLNHESNLETRRYRNHEKRTAIAEEYLRAFGTFRRDIRDYAVARGAEADAKYQVMVAAARTAADTRELLRLYFDQTVQEYADRAGSFLGKMQLRAEKMVQDSADDLIELESYDDGAKAARNLLINSMKSQLGEQQARVKRQAA